MRGPSTVHSARPHLGVDTVWLATAFAQHLYTLAGRVTDARLPAVLTACRFEAGEAYNVIPQTVRFGGTLRCLDASTRAEMHAAMDAAAAGFAAMHGADVHVDFHDGAPPVINDAALFEYAVGAITEARGADALHVFTLPSMGAEDFAYYTERVPGLFVRVGTRSSARTAHPVHDALFDLDETALGPAARLMADLVMGRG